ncbi:helix-turn-helix domain-containing protein [Spirillospora sp. CA-255316]
MQSDHQFWANPVIRAAVEARDTGAVIRMARERFGLRQADLGAAAGYSRSTISRLERGRVRADDLGRLRAVAGALAMPESVLATMIGLGTGTEQKAGATVVTDVTTVAWEDVVRRRSFIAAAGVAVPLSVLSGLDEALAIAPAPARPVTGQQVAARLTRARRLWDTSALDPLLRQMPDLIGAAHQVADQHRDADGYVLLAGTYGLATEALNKVGAAPQSRLTADRAMLYASQSENPVAMAAAARALSVVLRHEGHPQLAERVTLQAADRVRKAGLHTVELAGAYAQMLCSCAYAAAQGDGLGDRATALELIGEARQVANRLPPPQPGGFGRFCLDAPQVALYEVGVHWALGDAGRALDVGRRLRPGMFPTAERRGRLCTDLARAWWLRGRPEQTAAQLLAAHAHAPAEVRDRPAIRAIAVDLVERHPRVSGARELAAIAHPARRNS